MPLPSRPDAVIFPKGKIQGGNNQDRIKAIFGPVLGCQKVWTNSGGDFNFTYPNVLDDGTVADHVSLLFPTGHPREKSPRFDWYAASQDKKTGAWTVDESAKLSYNAAPDRVKFGYLRPDVANGDDDYFLVDSAPIVDAVLVAVSPAKSPAFKPTANASTEN